MSLLRTKSITLTNFLEDLLLLPQPSPSSSFPPPYLIITPRNPAERGAQLSIKLKAGLLGSVLRALEDAGVVVDARKPDVIRVAPAPLYNTFIEVWEFARIFREVCAKLE